jgi:hypothetical protein
VDSFFEDLSRLQHAIDRHRDSGSFYRQWNGFRVWIENEKGSTRSGTGKNGKKWSVEMKNDYGYVYRTLGLDGDSLDVYLGDDKDSKRVFIVHQTDPETGEFDEDKVMLGFKTPESAKKAYLAHYDDDRFFGGMDEVSAEDFGEMVKSQRNAFKRMGV